jgi:hypothetical protein
MSEPEKGYLFAIFNSTNHLLAAEKVIKEGGLKYKIVPIPRFLSSDCGVCIRFRKDDRERFEALVREKIRDFVIESIDEENQI